MQRPHHINLPKSNFCHYSGEPSDGEITFVKPILHKNWRKAMEEFESGSDF